MMRAAVTGASGHIGNCLVRELKKQGARVKVLVRNFRNDLDELDVELIPGNLLEPESLKRLCEGVDVVFHLAARITIDNRQPDKVLSTNVTGTINLLKAAQAERVKKFIHFSSIEAFQTQNADLMLDENRSLVETNKPVYGFSKAEGERAVLQAVGEGLDAVILSPTAVIGPYDYLSSLLGQALIKIHQSRLPFLISGGYNWVDVRDVAAASIQAVQSGRKGEKYILSGDFCSLRELASIIRSISGCRIPPSVPVSLARLACPFIQAYAALTNEDPLYTQQSLDKLVNSPLIISCEKARKELKYNPFPIKQTLVDTFSWYRDNKYLI